MKKFNVSITHRFCFESQFIVIKAETALGALNKAKSLFPLNEFMNHTIVL